MEFKIINKYLQENNRTFVAIRQDAPYTAFDRVLIYKKKDAHLYQSGQLTLTQLLNAF